MQGWDGLGWVRERDRAPFLVWTPHASIYPNCTPHSTPDSIPYTTPITNPPPYPPSLYFPYPLPTYFHPPLHNLNILPHPNCALRLHSTHTLSLAHLTLHSPHSQSYPTYNLPILICTSASYPPLCIYFPSTSQPFPMNPSSHFFNYPIYSHPPPLHPLYTPSHLTPPAHPHPDSHHLHLYTRKGRGKSKCLPWTFIEVLCPSRDLHESLHPTLGLTF